MSTEDRPADCMHMHDRQHASTRDQTADANPSDPPVCSAPAATRDAPTSLHNWLSPPHMSRAPDERPAHVRDRGMPEDASGSDSDSEPDPELDDPDPDVTDAILAGLLGRLDVSGGPSGDEFVDFEARPPGEAWQPAESVAVWVARVWQQLPAPLREWCEKVEDQSVGRKGPRILPKLRERVGTPAPELRLQAVRAAFEEEKIGDGAWLSSRESLQSAFPPSFGRAEYRWTDDVTDLEWVMAVADCLISLCQPVTLHDCLDWTTTVVIKEPPADWSGGGVHKQWRRWEGMPECSDRVKKWVKDRVWVAPTGPVPTIDKKNATCLRPGHREFDREKHAFVDKKVKKDFLANVTRKLATKPAVVSPLNAVPKLNSKDPFRVISNMRELNKHFPGWTMKFDDIRMVRHMFRHDFFLWSLDQHAAYHTILAHPRLAEFFGFQWEGTFYAFNSLPFGFKLSPFFFCKLVRQLVKKWRRSGIAIQAFVDDQASGSATFFDAVMQRNLVMHDNIYFGFTLSTKSDPLPFQRLRFLGFILHLACPTPCMHTPADKVDMLSTAARLVANTGDFPEDAAEAREAMASVVAAGGAVELAGAGPAAASSQPRTKEEYSEARLAQLVDAHPWPTNPLLLDFCAGVSCGGRALLPLVPRMKELAFEVEPESKFRPRMKAEQDVHDRITFVIGDLGNMTYESLVTLVTSHGHTMSDIVCVIYSPPCRTNSKNLGGKQLWDPVFRRYTHHRHADMSPKSSFAIAHDAMLTSMFEILHAVTDTCPAVMIVVENPVSDVWPSLPPVIEAKARQGWTFVERSDHCRMADSSDTAAFPQKPTSWLLFNVPNFVPRVCESESGCPFRSTIDPSFHAMVIRNSTAAKVHMRGQTVVWDSVDKSRIPSGAYRRFLFQHLLSQSRSAHTSHDKLHIPPSFVVRKLAKIAGRLLSMGFSVEPVRMMSRETFHAIYAPGSVDWDSAVAGSEPLVRELLWVAAHLATWNDRGLPIWQDTSVTQLTLTQDSSPVGVGFDLTGAIEGRHVRHGGTMLWKPAEARLDHVHRELVGAILAMLRVRSVVAGRTVVLQVDSKSSQKYVRDGGGRSRFMTRLARILWGLCLRARITLRVEWIPGTRMIELGTDGRSRPKVPKPLSTRDYNQWRMHPSWFVRIVEWSMREAQGGYPTIDLFARRVDRQVERFCSEVVGELGALRPANAFAHDWSGERCWAFPPPKLVATVAAHARKSKAQVLLVCPVWVRDWCPTVLSEATARWEPRRNLTPFFQRLREGEWQDVEAHLFDVMVLMLDFRATRYHIGMPCLGGGPG